MSKWTIYNSVEQAKDVGRIESNSLRQGDCLDVMKHISDNSVDMALTDPPYG